MKTFKYKFSNMQRALILVGMLLCGAGFAVNLVFCIRNGIKDAQYPVYPILQYSLMFFVSVGAFILLASILCLSCYVIDEKHFKTRFGFIVSKYDLKKITDVTLNRKTKKLTVTFDSGEFIVIVVRQDWYEEFIEALLAANPEIEYSVISLENDDVDKLV